MLFPYEMPVFPGCHRFANAFIRPPQPSRATPVIKITAMGRPTETHALLRVSALFVYLSLLVVVASTAYPTLDICTVERIRTSFISPSDISTAYFVVFQHLYRSHHAITSVTLQRG